MIPKKKEEESIRNYYREYFEKNKIQYQNEDLDYFNYVHIEFKQEKIKEKIEEWENNRIFEQKRLLGNSEYNDAYPNTDNQYNIGVNSEYANYDSEIFEKFKNNENNEKEVEN